MKILFIGSNGTLSTTPLQKLIQSKHDVCAIAHDKENTASNISIINLSTDSVDAIAHVNQIPLLTLTKNTNLNIQSICTIKPDIIIVSCYSHKLPKSITNFPRLGCFNLHPSLLPKYRGPDPLFWQLRQGDNEFGITIHKVSENFDEGQIINQKRISIENGLNISDIKTSVANQLGDLLLDTLNNLQAHQLTACDQDESFANYQSAPMMNDYTLSIHWSAKHLFNFICAYQQSGRYFVCCVEDKKFHIASAISYTENKFLDKPYKISENYINLNCHNGFIECQLAAHTL